MGRVLAIVLCKLMASCVCMLSNRALHSATGMLSRDPLYVLSCSKWRSSNISNRHRAADALQHSNTLLLDAWRHIHGLETFVVQGAALSTVYCGDGINDIAALAGADVGMVIGATDAVVAASLSTARKSAAGDVLLPCVQNSCNWQLPHHCLLQSDQNCNVIHR